MGDSDRPLYRFVIADIASFQFDSLSIDVISKFVSRTGFYSITAPQLYQSLVSYSTDGLLVKERFIMWVRAQFSNPSDSDMRFLECLFNAFDRNNSAVVDVAEFTCGLSVFCNGSKSEKLLFAFDLMDDESIGVLSKRGLWRFFRSFLGMLLTLSGTASKIGKSFHSILDNCSVWTAAEVLKQFKMSAAQDVPSVSFEEIADWYSKIGCQRATWLELLDLKKWLIVGDSGVQSAHHLRSRSGTDSSAEDIDSKEAKGAGKLQFNLDLGLDQSLLIYESDVERVQFLLSNNYILRKDAHLLVQELHKISSNGCITRDDFEDFMEPYCSDSHDEFEQVSSTMDNILGIFDSFDPHKQGFVRFPMLATGLTVLCKGSKSKKLEIGFRLFDVRRENKLNIGLMKLFLQSYLTVLVSVTAYTSLNSVAMSDVCLKLANSICGVAGAADFATFSEWYNNGGHKDASWIALIDRTKWVQWDDTDDVNDGGDDEDDIQDEPYDDSEIQSGEHYIMRLKTNADDAQISIPKVSSAYVYRLASILGLTLLTPEETGDVFASRSEDGLISIANFDSCIIRFTSDSSDSLSEKVKDEYTYILHSLFYAFDKANGGSLVDSSELACGFSILCKGSKSDKLAFAFDLFDDDKDEHLTKRGLWRYFRSFLAALLTLSGALDDLQPDESNNLIDAATRRTCDSVMTTIYPLRKVSFTAIAEWYNEYCEDFPWLELLDLNKWNQLALS